MGFKLQTTCFASNKSANCVSNTCLILLYILHTLVGALLSQPIQLPLFLQLNGFIQNWSFCRISKRVFAECHMSCQVATGLLSCFLAATGIASNWFFSFPDTLQPFFLSSWVWEIIISRILVFYFNKYRLHLSDNFKCNSIMFFWGGAHFVSPWDRFAFEALDIKIRTSKKWSRAQFRVEIT